MAPGIPIELESAVTTIVLQRPYPQQIQAYENWLKQMVSLVQQSAGHRGVNVIRPHGPGHDYTIVLHFASEATLQNWLESDTRRQMIQQVRPLLNTEETVNVTTGLEFWFTPPQVNFMSSMIDCGREKPNDASYC